MSRPVVSWIEHHARRIPDRIALIDLHRGRETTDGEPDELLDWCRARLARCKVPGPLRASVHGAGQDRSHA